MHEPPPADFDDHARPNRFEIDLGAIAQFTREIRTLVGDGVTVFAALKCNAYGFGLVPVARTILAAGGNALSLVDRANAAGGADNITAMVIRIDRRTAPT